MAGSNDSSQDSGENSRDAVVGRIIADAEQLEREGDALTGAQLRVFAAAVHYNWGR